MIELVTAAERLVTAAVRLYRLLTDSRRGGASSDSPSASQRDIAIAVSSGEAARRAGLDASADAMARREREPEAR